MKGLRQNGSIENEYLTKKIISLLIVHFTCDSAWLSQNVMQMRKTYCLSSFALDSAHVKFDV
jgi:hypothetical protein